MDDDFERRDGPAGWGRLLKRHDRLQTLIAQDNIDAREMDPKVVIHGALFSVGWRFANRNRYLGDMRTLPT
jgi:hypothetical protein